MKTCLLAYHKNIDQLYPPEWIGQYKQSILNQTCKDFSIMEINYGGKGERIFETSYFESVEMPTFIHALNYLLDKCVSGGYDCVLNSNVDDYFGLQRVEKQVAAIRDGYDIVASNFIRTWQGVRGYREALIFNDLDIKYELGKNHNVIGHPVVAYSRNFIEHNGYIPEQQPTEDLQLWQRTVDKFKFIILPEFLFTHRVHENSVCNSNNK